jgi:hypothetical protein
VGEVRESKFSPVAVCRLITPIKSMVKLEKKRTGSAIRIRRRRNMRINVS